MKPEFVLRISIIISTVAAVSGVLSQDTPTNGTRSIPEGTNICIHQTNCAACFTVDPKCAWCKQEDFDKNTLASRCNTYNNLVIAACPTDEIEYPELSAHNTENKPLSTNDTEPHQVVQLAPQRVNLKLRPGLPYNLRVTFRQAEDYPVDLYYLMDLSKSMEDDKNNLAQLGDLLAAKMSKITKDFRLGFGSFVDKIVMPYVSTVPEKLIEPCPQCAAPYGFKNHMQLSIKTEEFKEKVTEAKVSGNLDAPEGGFDAIMQSIVCEKQIGWREQSRKLLVFSTDSGFHYAGDGKLGGIVKPNDGNCHLDSKGFYTESTEMDYPSLSQLNMKVKTKNVNLIFAVTGNQVRVYERLSENLDGASTGQLANDSSNVVDLIKQQYDKITSEVDLRDNAPNEFVEVSYYSKCINGTTAENTNVCTGLKVGTKIEFEVRFKVKKCPTDPKDWNKKIVISPVGINEKLTVNLEMLCQCKCERPENRVRSVNKCEGRGTYQCGICDCDDKYHGRQCECSPDTHIKEDESKCTPPTERNKTKPEICYGQGKCVCNECECFKDKNDNPRFYGAFCKCSDTACPRFQGKLCGGHGDCICNECHCDEGWWKEACSCPVSNASCTAPGSDLVCNGKGECDCGKCKCNDSLNHSGQFCDECPTCGGRCSRFRHCVQCKIFESGEYDAERCNLCKDKMTVVDKAEVHNVTEQVCVFKDEEDDCKFTFVYGYDETSEPYIRVQRTKDCPPPVNILMIVLGVIGGIVAIGLCLLLIWKLLTTIHDRREFAKFEKERQMAKWDTGENPIFKQATSTFKNPTYGGK